ncbi:Uncharacterised protein [uncultured archaeon]|nr:Uncharacterised protein [uncultured archaeon]
MEEKKEIDVPKILLYSLELIVFILVLLYIYSSRNPTEPQGVYSESAQKETIKSLMNALELQNVHDVPLIGLTPRIQIYIQEEQHFVSSYYLEITRGKVIINNGVSNQTDIIIRTTQQEILKAVNDTSYMKESLSSGKTIVTKTTSKFVLYTEGYPDNLLN